MGIFDAFTGAPMKRAAQQQRQYYDQVGNDLNAGLERGIGYTQGGLTDAYGRLDRGANDAYGDISRGGFQARGDINRGARGALGALDSGTGQAADYFNRQAGAYAPLSNLASRYGRGASLYDDALGINGPTGNQRVMGGGPNPGQGTGFSAPGTMSNQTFGAPPQTGGLDPNPNGVSAPGQMSNQTFGGMPGGGGGGWGGGGGGWGGPRRGGMDPRFPNPNGVSAPGQMSNQTVNLSPNAGGTSAPGVMSDTGQTFGGAPGGMTDAGPTSGLYSGETSAPGGMSNQTFGNPADVSGGGGASAPGQMSNQVMGNPADLQPQAGGPNPSGGTQGAVGAFQASPGYQWQKDQATDAVARSANARGALGSGNTSAAISDRAGNMANQEYGSWLNRLQGYQPLEMSATQGAAAGQAGAYGNMGNLYAGSGRDQAGIYTGQGGQLAGLAQGTGQSLGNLRYGAGTTGAGLAYGGGRDLAGLVQNAGSQKAGMAGMYGKTYGDEAQAAQAASGNLWNFGMQAATAAMGMPGMGGGMFGGRSTMQPSPNGPGTYSPMFQRNWFS